MDIFKRLFLKTVQPHDAPDLHVQQGIIKGMKQALTNLRGSTPKKPMSEPDQANYKHICELAHIRGVRVQAIRASIRKLDDNQLYTEFGIYDQRVAYDLRDFIRRTPELDQ